MADGYDIETLSWRSDENAAAEALGRGFLRTAYRIGPIFNLTSAYSGGPMEQSFNYSFWNIATIPTILSAKRLLLNSLLYTTEAEFDGLYAMRAKSVNARWTTYASQPVVMVRCLGSKRHSENVRYIREDDSQSLLPNAVNLFEPHVSIWMNKTHRDGEQIPPLWMSSPDNSRTPLALVFDPGNLQRLMVCTVNSFWHRTLTTLVPVNMGSMIQTGLPESKEAILKGDMTKIVLDIGFMSSLGSPCGNILGTRLALCIADALSWIAGFQQIDGNPDSNFQYRAAHGYYGTESIDLTKMNTFEVVETIDGYGYGSQDMSIRLSVAIMVAYCVITIAYVAYIISTGHTSIAWDSATELIMLALQSKEPAGLGHISVGLDSMDTFRKGVGIRVSSIEDEGTGQEVERLELVFEDDVEDKKRGLAKLKRGKAY